MLPLPVITTLPVAVAIGPGAVKFAVAVQPPTGMVEEYAAEIPGDPPQFEVQLVNTFGAPATAVQVKAVAKLSEFVPAAQCDVLVMLLPVVPLPASATVKL